MGSAIANLILGIIASTIVWVVFSKVVQPKFTISKEISKIPSLVYKTNLFKIKIENKGLFEIYDIQITGRFQIYGLSADRLDKPSIYVARIGEGSHPYIEGYFENRKLDVTGREFLVRPTKEAKKQLSTLWDIPRQNNVTVEMILGKDERNCLDVTVIACHKFSSARRSVKTRYYIKDIRQQYFSNKGVGLRESKDD